MHGEDAPAWAHWLEASALGVLARSEGWTYAAANTLHVLGLAALFGAILAFDLRVLGAARAVPLPAAAGLLLPLARLGFALALLSGLVLLAADATHVAVNPAFRAKLAFLALALLNVLAFHAMERRGAPEPARRLSAAASLLLWVAVIASGRLIAYL
ncbi:DUF6644 family protein [Crenalkalicoccus roseus]|uniref:DUF6644 family protein n=1 Tax=Crenalkalicoccus roseus TaxID=1485588 RepID=UPI001081B63F|nr:DUF6644 family protein [Crenalkalicoccus roseus]